MTFIVFEGNEGVGKTTQIKRVATCLQQLGKKVHVTREPGGTPFADHIRALFKAVPTEDPPLPLTELYLVTAARAQHCISKIQPALQKNEVILCDRFIDSTYVYQGFVGGLDFKTIQNISYPAVGELLPSVVFLFDMSTEEIQKRLNARNTVGAIRDRNDEKGMQTIEMWAAGYRRLLQEKVPYPCGKVPHRVLIPANDSVENIETKLMMEIQKVL